MLVAEAEAAGCRERRTVVFGPKGEVSSADEVLREKADDDPRYIVHCARGWYEPDPREHHAARSACLQNQVQARKMIVLRTHGKLRASVSAGREDREGGRRT